jgi:hypothetical protein
MLRMNFACPRFMLEVGLGRMSAAVEAMRAKGAPSVVAAADVTG